MPPNPTNLKGLEAMDATKPNKYIGFGGHGCHQTFYKFISLGAMDATKPHEFIGLGAMDATKLYEFIGFGGHGRHRTL